MKHRIRFLPCRVRAALPLAAALAVAAPGVALAQGHEPGPPPDCVAPGGSDANGDGFDDALVSTRAAIVESEISCDAAIGPGTRVVRARVVPATDGPEFVSPAIGARGFVGEGALIEGAVLGNAATVLGGAQLISNLNSQVILGNRVFVGRDAVITGGNGDAEIGNGSVILRGATIRGGLYGNRLQLGAGSTLEDAFTGRNVAIGANTTIGFDSFIVRGARIGNGVEIDGFVSIGARADVGDGTTIATGAEIGARAVIGKHVTIERATIGRGATIGDGATIELGAEIPDRAVVAPGEVVSGTGP